MQEALTLKQVKKHKDYKNSAMCCILIAPLFTKVGREGVVPRIGYLDYRSANYIHFYCVGYGGYWHKSNFPDMQKIGTVKYEEGVEIVWGFSQCMFGKFVEELERETAWNYSGETELLIMGPDVDFSQCLIFNIDAMLNDKALNNSSELFEALIKYAKTSSASPSAYKFSDEKAVEQVIMFTIDTIFSLIPKPAQSLWKRGKHYAIKNINR